MNVSKSNKCFAQGRRGFFISLEGPEGAGKTTQLDLLARGLEKSGYEVLRTREPGGTELGEQLRRLLKYTWKRSALCPQAELLMMAASRAQLLREVIKPALKAGQAVLCDRFLDSTTAYQGAGRKLDLGFIEQLHRFTVGDWRPDLTLLLDLSVNESRCRSGQRTVGNTVQDRFESEDSQFHQRVRDGFLNLARQVPERIKVIDATQPPGSVHREIMRRVKEVLHGNM